MAAIVCIEIDGWLIYEQRRTEMDQAEEKDMDQREESEPPPPVHNNRGHPILMRVCRTIDWNPSRERASITEICGDYM
jgi:hypothetical protein